MREFGERGLRIVLALGQRQRLTAADAEVPAAVADPGRAGKQFLEAASRSEQAREILRPLVRARADVERQVGHRSEEQTSELQSLTRISYAVICTQQKRHR